MHPYHQAWSLPSSNGQPAPAWGTCQGPGPMPSVFPEQPGVTQGSAPQPMRTALLPCPPSHDTEQRPALGSTSPTENGQSSDVTVDPGDQGKCPAFTDSPALWPEAGGHGRAPSRFSYSQLTPPPGTTTMCEGSEQSPGATAPGARPRGSPPARCLSLQLSALHRPPRGRVTQACPPGELAEGLC